MDYRQCKEHIIKSKTGKYALRHNQQGKRRGKLPAAAPTELFFEEVNWKVDHRRAAMRAGSR